jgi:hypothetical protein
MIGCLLWHWYPHDVRSFAWYIMLHFEAARLLFNLQRNVLNFRKRYQLHLKCIQWLLSTMHVLLCRYHLQWECQRSCCVSITRDHVQDLFQNGSRYVIDLLALSHSLDAPPGFVSSIFKQTNQKQICSTNLTITWTTNDLEWVLFNWLSAWKPRCRPDEVEIILQTASPTKGVCSLCDFGPLSSALRRWSCYFHLVKRFANCVLQYVLFTNLQVIILNWCAKLVRMHDSVDKIKQKLYSTSWKQGWY